VSRAASLLRRTRPALSAETLIAAASLCLATCANTAFWHGALADRGAADLHTWVFAGAVLVILVSLHFLLIAAIAPRRGLRPILAALVVASVLADHFMTRYGIVLDASMLRNVVHTDTREAAELVTLDTLAALLLGALAALFCCNVRLRPRPFWTGLRRRAAAMAVAAVALLAALLLVFQDASSLMRNHKSLRYAINPASAVWSLGTLLIADARAIGDQRDPPEPVQRTAARDGRRPTLFVMVVGETARAANFSLNGYARPTNPELSRLDLVDFSRVQACGTSTEVSLPCMFSPFGRTDYDEARIRRHESLLHVLARAGYRVVWLDNQSGCKGVCDGLETRTLTQESVPGICAGGRCYDEILAHALARTLQAEAADTVVVMHQLGNHGPAYFRRYPPDMKRFAPACEKEELRDCSREEIVNAYDNAIAYTDRFLAGVIGRLAALRDRYDVVLAYVSDHGESLGEKGLYLHGVPYAIAPAEQLHVPMLWWLPAQTAADLGVDASCFRAKSARALSHDNLYHSIMGLLGVKTPSYRPERDLFSDCRRPPA
jgi:lipid A ethanolaminephosphotransferase